MKLLTLLLILLSFNTIADVEVIAGVKTYHINYRYENEQNKLVAIRYNNYFAAYFDNSFSRETAAIGKDWQYNKYFGVLYGASYGYCYENILQPDPEDCTKRVLPLLAPYAKVAYQRVNARLLLFGNAIVATIGVTF